MIGQGSFSRVYAGSWRDRLVAIKVLHDFTPASTFRREVELWRRLKHPQVVRMFGASSAHGSKPWFIVSELYERGSLVEWLLTMARDDYATPREVDQFRFISQIAGGMEYLHAQGVVHGDLKVRERHDVPTLCSCIGTVCKCVRECRRKLCHC